MAEEENLANDDEMSYRVLMSEGGRIVIPAGVRKALGVGAGDALTLRVEGNELRLLPQREAVRRAQQIVARRIAAGRSLVKELHEERRREAERE